MSELGLEDRERFEQRVLPHVDAASPSRVGCCAGIQRGRQLPVLQKRFIAIAKDERSKMFRQLMMIWLVLLVAALGVVTSVTRFIEKCRAPHGISKSPESTVPSSQAMLKHQQIEPAHQLR